jgi:hypothetical protein
MVPYFFASWWCEFWAAQRLAPQVDRRALRSALGRANALSYVLMIGGTTAWLAVAIAEFNDEKAACLERGDTKACTDLFQRAEYTFSDSADDLLRRLCERSHVEACTATSFRAAGDGNLAKTRLWGERACALGTANHLAVQDFVFQLRWPSRWGPTSPTRTKTVCPTSRSS